MVYLRSNHHYVYNVYLYYYLNPSPKNGVEIARYFFSYFFFHQIYGNYDNVLLEDLR